MMDQSLAIELKNITKTFKIEIEDTTKEKNALNRFPTKTIENKVLDDISIQVKKGELLGIIGLNGSGKSTLLSIMARIMEPDSGTIEARGKVSSILELGMGFHQDLSGRENIYIKGEMYGFTRKQIDERIENIIDFAGIRNYIDNPLRTYSSGMQGRLAFSVMVNVDADVMLLDEIMSTGDPSFTSRADLLFKKQLKSGKTVVFASQNASQLEQLCTRIVWINKGKIVANGSPKQVCAMFQNSINDSVEIVTAFANNGMADSQYKLALMYRDGIKVGKDESLYKAWLSKAATQGHAQAQVTYADLLMNSESEQDRLDAIAFYQSSALKGNADAKMKLSSLANNGKNVQDRDEIREIWRQLALVGHPNNKFQYGMLLLRSAWNDDDRKEAFKWITAYADEGSPDAALQAANMCRDGVGTPKDTEKYISYLTKSADIGHLEAIRNLADAYYNGKLILKDDKKAFELYLKGAKMGHSGMQYQVAVMYRDGIGVEKNPQESENWFTAYSNSVLSNYQISAADQLKLFDIKTVATPESLLQKAAESYNQRAISLLAAHYRGDTNAVISDSEKSQYYYTLAASVPGNPRITLADLYYKGLVFQQDFNKAAELYSGLTYTCNADVDLRLYYMYHNGQGFEKNENKALGFLKRSAIRGNLDANRILKQIERTTQAKAAPSKPVQPAPAPQPPAQSNPPQAQPSPAPQQAAPSKPAQPAPAPQSEGKSGTN